eukprot:6616626-Pyramimonas_sp.AAC.1
MANHAAAKTEKRRRAHNRVQQIQTLEDGGLLVAEESAVGTKSGPGPRDTTVDRRRRTVI